MCETTISGHLSFVDIMSQLSSMEAVQSEASKAHLMSQKLKVRVAELEAQLEAAHEARDRSSEEKLALEADLEVMRDVCHQQRQQLFERSASVGECMTSFLFLSGTITYFSRVV